jgi:crotonobetainyl-CoA:carnitine CoA-transferase CaiB-like acyl-CoA transferase
LLFRDPAQTHGLVPYFQVMNRGKKSMTLNLRDQRGLDVFYRLLRKADVVTENWRVGVAEKLGVDYPTLAKHNPNIIVVTGTSYGLKGPDAKVGSTDISGVSRAGLLSQHSRSISGEGKEIFYSTVYEGDAAGAMMLAYSVLLGIIARERHGVGQHVEVSQLASVMWFQTMPLGMFLIQQEVVPGYQRSKARNFTYKHYRCGDGKWICLSQPQPQIYWPILVDVLGLSHLRSDPRFDKIGAGLNRIGGVAVDFDITDISDLIDKTFLTRPAAEWLKLLQEKNIDCCLVNDYPDLLSDPQVTENEYITEVMHQSGVPLKMIGVPVKLSKTPGRIKGAAPEFGQDTEEVLLEAGYTWEQIEYLRKNGII